MLESLSLPMLGIKGAGAEAWLREQGIEVPPATYETRQLSGGGLIARLGSSDFFLEGGPSGELLPRLAAELARNPPRVYRVERHDAAFLLSGPLAVKVLAQLCSFDFRSAPPGRVVMTRAAGVNCTVLPGAADEVPSFRLWIDCTFAAYFGEMLAQISEELGRIAKERS
jgi:sarcosine oxidase subunit gamma